MSKRTIGLFIMGAAQLMNATGLNIEISETDVDTIATAIGGVVSGIGVIHEYVKKFKEKKSVGQK